MAELRKFDDFRKFVKFNEDFVDSNPFFYFHLQRTIERVLQKEVRYYKAFNVLEEERFFVGLIVENECLLYANDITEDMIPLVAEGLELEKFNRYQFFGTKNIIDALFNIYNVTFSEQKYRKYYECLEVRKPFRYAEGTASMADIDQLQTLVDMSYTFNEEFYEGEKEAEDGLAVILSGIQKRNLFQWIYQNNVVSIAQVIYDEFDYPVIGLVFTHPHFRGKGFASSLTYEITKGLLENGHEKCWLMTNAYNPLSNRAFKKVGYQLIGEYVVRYKEK